MEIKALRVFFIFPLFQCLNIKFMETPAIELSEVFFFYGFKHLIEKELKMKIAAKYEL